MESSSVMNCLMFCKEEDDLHFFFKLAVMLARALFAGGVAMVGAREQVMFNTRYVAVFMATEIITQAFY